MKRYLLLLSFLLISFYFLSAQTMQKEFALRTVEKRVPIQKTFLTDTILNSPINQSIFGIGITGYAVLNSDNSCVRVIAITPAGAKYLIYENYPLLSETDSSSFSQIGIETAILENISIEYLQLEIADAKLWIDSFEYINSPDNSPSNNIKQKKITSYEEYAIRQLNKNLSKKNALWRAGKTSISGLSYEEKSAIFRDSMPNTEGFEYYIGGIFATPDIPSTLPRKQTQCIPSWDWRNRHGKNWITAVKNQGTCGSCWAFAAIGAVEAYTNLYFNQSLNLDLSEQELISCNPYNMDCNGGFPTLALSLISDRGVVDEQCFPYIMDEGNCQYCSNPTETITIGHEDWGELSSEDELKQYLFRSPVTLDLDGWRHAILLIGYKTLAAGDTIYMDNVGNGYSDDWIIVPKESPLIGQTAWLFKNSYGTEWGEDGFGWMVVDWNNIKGSWTAIKGDISSLQYDDTDILITDEDGDGFYFWGIGNKPSGLPDWIPDSPDGNDADPNKGPLDAFGFEQDLSPSSLESIVIREKTIWNTRKQVNPNLIVKDGGELTISAAVFMNRDSKIIVEAGGCLIVDGGIINQACIKICSGGKFILRNNGQLKRKDADVFETELGSEIWIESGTIW